MTSPLAQAIALQNAVNPAQTGIAPTDVVGSYKLASDVAEKNYAAKLAANNAMWGGLAGLGGAGLLAFGPSAAKSWFGQGVTAATPTAAGSATSAAVPGAASATGIDAAAPLTFSGLPMGTIDASAPLAASMAAPTVAADLGAAAAPEAAAAGTDLLASLPEWLLPLIFAA